MSAGPRPSDAAAERALLGELSRVVAMAQTPDALLAAACRLAHRALPLQTVVLCWQQGGRLEQRSWRSRRVAPTQLARARRQAASVHRYFTAGARSPRAGMPRDANRFVTLPLVVGSGSVFGVTGLGCRSSLDERSLALASALTNQLAIALQRLEARRVQEALLSRVTHELGNFTLAMRLSLQTLASTLGGRAPEALGDLQFLSHQVDVLRRDLEARGDAEPQGVRLSREQLDLGALAQLAVRTFQPAALAGAVTLTCEVSPGLPWTFADPLRLAQVFSNLIANALRFTPRGGRIEVRVRRAGAALRATVEDSGPGFGTEGARRVFEPRRPTAPLPHRGLGLNICEGIMRAHQGRIWLERGRRAPTRLHFTVPVAGT